MKIALIGATGFVGSHILEELAHRGYDVLALARSVDKIKTVGIETAVVDVTNVEALSQLIKGYDVVISAFNAGWDNPNIYLDFMNGSKAIQEAVEKAGVKRYIIVGGAGSLYIEGKQIVDGPHFPAKFRAGATAARDYLNVLKESGELDWTFVSPALDMYPGERTGKYRIGTDSPVFDDKGESIISVQDLAVAIVDEVTNHRFSRARFTVGY